MTRFVLMLLNSLILIVPLLYTLIAGLGVYGLGLAFKSPTLKKYGYNLMIGVDQMANVVLLGFPDETISGRTGRAIASGAAKWYIKLWRIVLDAGARLFGDENHALNSIEPEDDFDKRRAEELWHWSKEKRQPK